MIEVYDFTIYIKCCVWYWPLVFDSEKNALQIWEMDGVSKY